jgi:hypothetical protein
MIKIVASTHFIKFKKRASPKLQLEIDNQVKAILDNPEIGELKKGDLKGTRVLKFKFGHQEYLLSYEMREKFLHLYLVGSHENYYVKLKRFLH